MHGPLVLATCRAWPNLSSKAHPEAPRYTHVEGALGGDELILVEVELHEPGLWLQLAPGSADRFADATLAQQEATA